MRKLKLRGRLILSFFLIILITVSGLVIYVWMAPLQTLASTAASLNRRQAANFAPLLAEFYGTTGSWEDAERYTDILINPAQIASTPSIIGPLVQIDLKSVFAIERAIITDQQHLVLADSAQQLTQGVILPADFQASSIPIIYNGIDVGNLTLTVSFGENLLGGFRSTFQRIVTIMIVWSGLIAIIVSLYLAQQLSRPLRTLDSAAHTLSLGKSIEPILVTSEDEIGSLTATFNKMAQGIQLQKQLRQQLVADIAHELRTPLAVMNLEIEAVEDGLQTAENATPTLKRKISTLDRLITDLRLLSLADARELELKPTLLDLEEFLLQLISNWANKAAASNIHLDLNLCSTKPTILVDEQRFYQIFQNLISNAIRHTPPNGRIEIGSREESTTIQLWVKDTGAGIPHEKLPYIFNRFYRADESRSRETGGSGLGLAITQRLVYLHDGQITAESEIEQGTTFYLRFPKTS